MSFLDKVKDAVADNQDKVNQTVDKVGDIVDQKTGGQHSEQINKAERFLKDQVKKQAEGNK